MNLGFEGGHLFVSMNIISDWEREEVCKMVAIDVLVGSGNIYSRC